MTARSRRFRLATAAGLVAVCWLGGWDRPVVTRAPAGARLQAMVDQAPAGGTVVLGPGTHRGPVSIRRRVTLVGAPGARLSANGADVVLTVRAAGTRVRGLRVEGGSTGILAEGVNGVEIEDVDVRGADLHGIEVVDASARIVSARVSDLRSSFAQGMEIRNSSGRPQTLVKGSTVLGGREGIVSHVADVQVEGNLVAATSTRAIAITEMSDGTAEGNRISGAAGAGLYCGDMSRCAFEDNRVEGVTRGEGGRSAAGWGLVVQYHASASSNGDLLEGESGAVATLTGSRVLARSPLEPGAGWRVLGPGVLAVAAAALLLLASYGAGELLARTRGRAGGLLGAPASQSALGPGRRRRSSWGVAAVLLAGLGVQTFHMGEHVLQVFRVHADGVPSRGGLVGPAVEPEWVHFAYNSAVLAFMVAIFLARRHAWRPPGNIAVGDRLLAGGLLIQGYHVVEHTAKLAQHLVTGAKVNPGLLGQHIDLVWLHFAVNLAVYAALVAAFAAYHRRQPSFSGRLLPSASSAGAS